MNNQQDEQERLEENTLENGMMVTLKKDYHSDPFEVFKLSQAEGDRAWAGDKNGRGWYIRTHQIDIILGNIEQEGEECEDCQGNCYLENDDQWVICSNCYGLGVVIDDDYGYAEQRNFD